MEEYIRNLVPDLLLTPKVELLTVSDMINCTRRSIYSLLSFPVFYRLQYPTARDRKLAGSDKSAGCEDSCTLGLR